MQSSKRLLGVWRAMHNRCYNKNQNSYQNYGARGIIVEACWHGAEGFKKFLEDMGECPEGGTLDRIDNNANYGPANCRWATRLEQARNKRNNVFITVNGQTKTIAEWARALGCNPAAITYRLKSGMSEQEAVTKPVPERPNSKLKPEDAVFVLKTYPAMTAQAIANKLGVSKKTVLNIIHRRTFTDVLVGI